MARLISFKTQESADQQMSLLMKAVKSVHSVSSSGDSLDLDDIKKQRQGQNRFSSLATPARSIETESINVKGIPAEWVRPNYKHNTRHIIMYCHGGGYTCGSLKYARILASKLAIHTGLEVISFEYRLAPENPYPAAIEDALTIWNYIMQLGYGAREVVLIGDSAGGNLALELALRLNSKKRILPKGIVLMSPWTDLTMSGESYHTCKDLDPMLTYEYIATARYSYVGLNESYNDDFANEVKMNDYSFDYSKPEYSPLFAEHFGFPPVLIQVGSNEILKSDSYRLFDKLTKEGVAASLEEYDDAWHVFQMMPIKKAAKALDAIGDFVDELF